MTQSSDKDIPREGLSREEFIKDAGRAGAILLGSGAVMGALDACGGSSPPAQPQRPARRRVSPRRRRSPWLRPMT